MILARRMMNRRYAESFLILMALGTTGGTACRRKDAATIANADPAPVSDGIVEGLQRELTTAQRLNADTADRVKSVRPTLKCVETTSPTEWRAHFGYTNTSSDAVTIPVGLFNRIWPPPLGRAQPAIFAPGAKEDVAQATFNPLGSTAWVLGSAFVMASARSTPCAKR